MRSYILKEVDEYSQFHGAGSLLSKVAHSDFAWNKGVKQPVFLGVRAEGKTFHIFVCLLINAVLFVVFYGFEVCE